MNKRQHIGIGLLIVCLLLWPVSLVAAQDDGGSEDKSYEIVRVNAIMALPTAINFRVNLTVPEAEIQGITLDLTQESGFERHIELDLEPSVFFRSETAMEYQYTFELLEVTDIAVFEAISFEFTVEVESLEEPLTAKSQAIVEHQVARRWFGTGDDDLRLYWVNEHLAGENYLGDLLPVLTLLKFQTNYDTPIRFVIYEPNTAFCQQLTLDDGTVLDVIFADGLVYSCNPADVKTFYTNLGFNYLEIGNTQPQTITNTLTETLVNIVYGPRWDGADVPLWFQVGLGLFYVNNGQPTMLSLAQRASQQDQLLNLTQLTNTEDRSPLWEAQAYLLTLYLAESYGASAPADIALAIHSDVNFNEALQMVTNDTLERIYAAWSIWVNSPRTSEVVLWNPYQATTPTPTPTLTPTDIPPSPTTRPSPTITPTSTRIPLYVPPIEATATRGIPTLRPTASFTPLPPGYFDTPTVAPATPKPKADSSSSGGVCGTGIGATLIPVIGLLVARRKRHD